MLIQRIRLLAVGLVIVLLSFACSNTKSNKFEAGNNNKTDQTLKRAGQTFNEASKTIEAQMGQLRDEMKANLAGIDEKLKQLETKRDAIKDTTSKDTANARLNALKTQRDDLQARIDQIEGQKKDETSWKKFEDDTKAAWHDLENGVKDLFDKLDAKTTSSK
jgi:TolA-binding protein